MITFVKFWRIYISPLYAWTNCCKFTPSCSAYTLQALKIHGTLKGSYLGVKRILRCNPFSKGGYDTVPQKEKEN